MRLEREQAEAIAEALLTPAPSEQQARAERLRRLRTRQRNASGVGAIVGLAPGSLLGHLASGHLFPGNAVGVLVGGRVGHAVGRLKARA